MFRRMLSKWTYGVMVVILLLSMLLPELPAPVKARPLLTLDRTALRQAQLPEGTAGMMAQYVPETGMIYLLGGYRRDGEDRVLADEVWSYDPVMDELHMIGNLPTGLALAGHAYVADEKLIYLFGGLVAEADTLVASDAIYTYHVVTGEVQKLSATLPSARTRAAATYTPTGIFVSGGVNGASAFSDSVDEIVHYSLTSDRVTGTFDLPGDWESSMADNYWVGAHYMAEIYPVQTHPEPYDYAAPQADAQIIVLGTHGYVRFDPSMGTILETRETNNLRGRLGAATAYLPMRRQILSVSGYEADEFFCADYGISALDPGRETMRTLTQSPIPVTGSTQEPVADTQHDAAAVYVPDLDRILIFGGFVNKTVITGQLCNLPWTDNPDADQYTTGIYSLSPEYYDEMDWSAPESQNTDKVLLLYEILNPIAGKPVNMKFYRANPDEQFAVAVQAPFRSADGNDYLMSRVLTPQIDDPDGVDLTVTLPDDISPHPSGQRTVAFCAVSQDRLLPPNCREVPVTLQPGALSGTITRDLTGIGGTGTEPVADAVVELRDADNDVVATVTTGSDGAYAFCEAGEYCLALGEYTLTVWREYKQVEDYVHLPASLAVDIKAEETMVMDVTLETTPVLGPTVRRLEADFDGLRGDPVGTFLSFDHLTGVNVPAVWNTFTVESQDFIPQRPTTKVRFEFEGTDFSHLDEDGSDGWQAEFDMSEVLTAGDNQLIVTAYDNQDLAGEPRAFPVETIPAKSIDDTWMWGSDGIRWLPEQEKYTFHFKTHTQRPPLSWPDAPPHELDLEVISLYSRFATDLELYESYRIDGFWSAEGDGEAVLQILSLSRNGNLVRYPASLKPQYIEQKEGNRVVSRTIDKYKMFMRVDLCEELGLSRCDEWIPLKRAIAYNKPVKDKKGHTILKRKMPIGLDMKYDANLYVTGYFDGDDLELDRVRVTPSPTLGVRGSIAFKVDAFIASVEVGAALAGEVDYSQPIVFEDNDIYLDDPCVQFIITLKLWIEGQVFGIGGETEWTEELLREYVPDGCSPTRLRTLYEAVDIQVPDYSPSPAAAVSSGGSVMRLWVEDVDTSVDGLDLALQYAYDDVDGVDSSGTLTDSLAIYDPGVAFFPDGSAIAVWSQINDMAGPDDTIAEVVLGQELYAAFWEQGSGWSAAQRITDNQVGDGRLVIATDASDDTRHAAVAWVRDADGDTATVEDWQVVTRRWEEGVWSDEEVVADAPAQTDWEPAIAYSGDGTLWVVWVRDADADFLTLGDRRLTYATYDATTGWSTAQQPSSWPARAMHPTIAFSPLSDWPLVAMVVSPDGSGDVAEASVTVQNRLYAAWRGPSAGEWDVQSVGNARGAWPQVTVYTDQHALIVLRGFGGGGEDGAPASNGQIAVAAGKLSEDGARWMPPGRITDQDTTVWQVGAVTLPIPDDPGHPVPDGKVQLVAVNDAMSTSPEGQRIATAQAWQQGTRAPVRMVGPRQATMLGGNNSTGIFEVADAMGGIDPYIETVSVSNPAPAPGEWVTVTATLRNQELRPMGSTDNTQLKMRLTCQNDVGCTSGTLDEGTYNGEMLFNEVLTFTLSYRSSGGLDRIRVVLENNPMDLDNTNNEHIFDVGGEVIPAPRAVQAAYVAPDQIDVRWQAPVDEEMGYQNLTGLPFAYRVYRAETETGALEWIGLAPTPFFFDSLASGDETLYYYAIQAHDVRGRYSPPSPRSQAEALGVESPSAELNNVFLPLVIR